MPCRTYETPEEIQRQDQIARERELAPLREEIHVLKQGLAEREAMLCGVLSSLYTLDGYWGASCKVEGKDMGFSSAVREQFDETESGVSWDQVQAWWLNHRAQDEARRKAEADALAEKRAVALAKLTPAERELLGV